MKGKGKKGAKDQDDDTISRGKSKGKSKGKEEIKGKNGKDDTKKGK